MDLDRYYELRTLLNTWKARLAEALRQKAEASPESQRRLQALYDQEGSSDSFDAWLSLWCRQAAIQWILRVLFLRVLEDRGLLGVERIRTSDGQRIWGQLTHNLGAASYLLWCCRDAAYLLPDLFGPTEFDFLLPDDDLIQRFFDDVWRRPDSNRTGWLRFDFRADPDHADEGFQTRFIGDLYQELDSEIRERHALLQTPHFVAQFILEHTLLKRFEEKNFRTVTLIDPTCGSGHFLVDAFWMFVKQYEQALKQSGEKVTVLERSKIARRIIEDHLFGCDINPYASALARFRLIIAACDYSRPASLQDLRNLHINIVNIDSLIPYEEIMRDGVWGIGESSKILGHIDDVRNALPVLRDRYDVVVGNPPYIFPTDKKKREVYKENSKTAIGRFGLSVPFIERFGILSTAGGFIGLIVSNSFATQGFGKVLVESYLPGFDLFGVIDLDGCYIPGHGTPTVILLFRNVIPNNDKVKLVYTLKGEGGIPEEPSLGKVWSSIVSLFSQEKAQNDYAAVELVSREYFSHHPWKLKLYEAKVVDRSKKLSPISLENWIKSIGLGAVTGSDELFVMPPDLARRLGINHDHLKPIISGEDIRDWSLNLGNVQLVIFPYKYIDSKLRVINWEEDSNEYKWFKPFKNLLGSRVTSGAGRTFDEVGRKFYEFHQFPSERYPKELYLVSPRMATHSHFGFNRLSTVYKDSAITFDLKKDLSQEEHLFTAAILNSSYGIFHLKQICYNRGSGEDPVRDRFAFNGEKIKEIPIPLNILEDSANRRKFLLLCNELLDQITNLSSLPTRRIFEQVGEAYQTWISVLESFILPSSSFPVAFNNSIKLQAGYRRLIARRQEIRSRMIFLQEEMDWLVYEMYGLINKAPLAEDFLSESEYKTARLDLGQRPFELAGKGYQGDWPAGYQPTPLPDFLRPLTEARIALIQSNPDIALLEDPLYKRRWIPPDYEKEFSEAASWWLAEKLEFALEQYGKPISLREWARLLADDERVNAVLEVLTGSPSFDRESELFKVVKTNTVSNRPEHIFNLSGLRKYINSPRNGEGILPEYESKDFSDPVAWRIRGKLNIPRERFIAYREFDSNWRGETIPDSAGPWFGWAGWNAVQRADALANLLERANRAGWEANFRQCGLRAALRDLLPELKDLPPAERSEFEAIATACGIGLETRCYCQAYKLAFSQREPCAPGVSAEILDLKPLEIEPEKPRRGRRKGPEEPAQLPLDLG